MGSGSFLPVEHIEPSIGLAGERDMLAGDFEVLTLVTSARPLAAGTPSRSIRRRFIDGMALAALLPSGSRMAPARRARPRWPDASDRSV